ncbi:MAG: aspartate/glutamate racemase family protein [Ignavibacteriaceae bacterium]|nr:aspartate/glutamate racemase family protein [Ignavibacteriaceae bacterium]
MKDSKIKLAVVLLLSSLIFCACNSEPLSTKKNLEQCILSDTSSYFYVNVNNYPEKNNKLPIGIFDSGTGGLTVMDAIVNFDGFNNESKNLNSDGILDFEKEYFIYLADQANMPYGNYPSCGKTDLLKEHILKDAQFLLSNKYYQSPNDNKFKTDKLPIKALVVACNTATAYGLEDIEKFLTKAKLNLKVIGVINAGVKGAFENISKDEDCSIGVMATEGTVSSKGYVNAINKYRTDLKFTGEIQVFQQAGVGLAGAIDGVSDYIDKHAKEIRKKYKGPSLSSKDAKIDIGILNRYNLDWSSNKVLYSGKKANPTDIQLNSIENYIYYNVVSLLEQIRKSSNAKPLKTIILGCTHYPFYKNVFAKKLKELYNLKENNEYIYRHLMHKEITLIDPAINTAKELYKYLKDNKLFGNESLTKSEFYISVPNVLNTNIEIDSSGNFTYEYKYGRIAGDIQEYVKQVPFSKVNLLPEVVTMLKEKTPLVYKLITDFNQNSSKTEFLRTANLGLL